MLLYKKYRQLNLDCFTRSKISMLFKCILDKRNDQDFPYLTTLFRCNIAIHNCPNNHFTKSKLVVELIIYDELDNVLHTNHINPFNPACIIETQRSYSGSYFQTKYKNFRTRIVYKIMNFPLGKLRLKHYRR